MSNKPKTLNAEIVEVTRGTHDNECAFSSLYGKFYCFLPDYKVSVYGCYLSPKGPQITAHYYDSTEELNKDLRGYIAMYFNK